MIELSHELYRWSLYANLGFVYKIDYRSGKLEQLAKILFSLSHHQSWEVR